MPQSGNEPRQEGGQPWFTELDLQRLVGVWIVVSGRKDGFGHGENLPCGRNVAPLPGDAAETIILSPQAAKTQSNRAGGGSAAGRWGGGTLVLKATSGWF
jgi:hypothetical protein